MPFSVGLGACVGLVVPAQVSAVSFQDFATRRASVLPRGNSALLEVHSLVWCCLVLVYWRWRVDVLAVDLLSIAVVVRFMPEKNLPGGLARINHVRASLQLWHVTNGKS